MPSRVSNAPEFTVSELAGNIKRTIEESFGRVRVRGELGRVTIARSGHAYLDLKDDRAVINSIMWKGTVSRLSMRPEEGMEVVVEGKMSTYPGRSNYQLVIDRMELAGEGALMALLDKRRKALAAEGLFDADRKRALPFMPRTIGVVTSPTGAVIRDILHRLEDRFPVHVIVWPVLVQGDKAAAQIAAAITGFNHGALSEEGGFSRPDVLIVARGGGSLEDLWCFNEEVVVRAAANSTIPLISAVGHETDTTLIDHVSDKRAPTPTGAAEVAVPVRDDLLDMVADLGLRAVRGLRRSVGDREMQLKSARLPQFTTVLGQPTQRLDGARLPSPDRLLEPSRSRLAAQYLPSPTHLIEARAARLSGLRLPPLSRIRAPKRARLELVAERLHSLGKTKLDRSAARMARVTERFGNHLFFARKKELAGRLDTAIAGLPRAAYQRLDAEGDRLDRVAGLLEAYSYQGVLQRGYALVTDADGCVIRSADEPDPGQPVTLGFADGTRAAVIDGATARRKPAARRKASQDGEPDTPQQSLF